MDYHLSTYEQLIKSLDGQKPTYQDLLNTQEWKKFRELVLLKDKNKCTVCGTMASVKEGNVHVRNFTDEEIEQQKIENEIEYELRKPTFVIDGIEIKLRRALKVGEFLDKPLYLHAHHRFYIFGNLPWEYEVSELETMCEKCHIKYHDENIVPVYSDSFKTYKLSLTPCSRCSGAGFLSLYSHVQGGICFRCYGAKFEEFIGKGIY